jgi:EAL domain-containing protein (putative c-di-GMP-specific phosphodiesterase class I)
VQRDLHQPEIAPPDRNGATARHANGGPRSDRERFVALAFCWGDLLFELDPDLTIVFAAGATASVLGCHPEDLVGRKIAELVLPDDQTLVRALLRAAEAHARIGEVSVRLSGNLGPTAPMAVAGYALPDFGNHYFLALRIAGAPPVLDDGLPAQRDSDSGMFAGESFVDIAKHRLKTAFARGDPVGLTFMSMGDLPALRQRLDAEAQSSLSRTLGACLREHSLEGDSAARLEDDGYSLVHSAEVDIAELERQVAAFARAADPLEQGVRVETATVDVDRDEISDEDLAKGLMYAINRFHEAKGREFTIKKLSTSLSALVSEAVEEVNTFKDLAGKGAFNVAFHPIVAVESGAIRHYEALARFPLSSDESPLRHILFAEETGLIKDFDLAMTRKVVDWLSKKPRNSDRYRVAVNISGNSAGDRAFAGDLAGLLREHMWTQGKLMFEITESSRITDLESANAFIQDLRRAGHEVCLDDFGAGAASFQYLSTLDVDVVKLDGDAVRNAQKAEKGRAFLSSLTELCRSLGVESIAEKVDDPDTLTFVRDCGVDYVQGHLFGRPSPNIRDFDPLPHRNLFPRREAAR